MTLVTPQPGETILASHVGQLTGLLSGVANKGQRIQLTQYSDAVNYANTFGQVDSTNGFIAKFQHGLAASPTTVATITKAGMTVVGALSAVTVTSSAALVGGALVLTKIATPATPAAGYADLYPKSDDNWYKLTEAADEVRILDADIFTAQGDLVYGTGAETFTQLAKGTALQALIMNSGATAPSWAASLQSLLTTTGAIPYASSANTPASLAISATKGDVLLAGATVPEYGRLARKNRLFNPHFRTKQRTTLGSTDNSYGIDGWRLLLEAANAAVITQGTVTDAPTDGAKNSAILTVGSGNNNKFGIWQPIEFANCAELRGKTVSLQLKLKSTAGIADVRAAVVEFTGTADTGVSGDPISAWGAAGTNPTLATNYAYCTGYTPVSLAPTTSWATYKIEGVSVGASANNLAVFIWSDDKTTTQTTDILRITDVQLEEGAICTQVERQSKVAEERDCFWWLYVYPNIAIGLAYSTIILTTDSCQSPPVPMRTAPSISGATFAVNSGSAGTVSSSVDSRNTLRFFNIDNNWTPNALVSLTATISAEL